MFIKSINNHIVQYENKEIEVNKIEEFEYIEHVDIIIVRKHNIQIQIKENMVAAIDEDEIDEFEDFEL